MRKCIISITKGGYELSEIIKSKDSSYKIFTLKKLTNKKEEEIIKLKDFINENFNKYDLIVFIMATGAVIRLIKDLIVNKKLDPAIIVMDQKGKNIISLLSGHLGKANEYTFEIAKLLNSNPVITTASDTLETISVDIFAKMNNLELVDYNAATKVTAHIVNGNKVNINYKLAENIKFSQNNNGVDGVITITNIDNVNLYKKNLVISMGCRKGKKTFEIVKFIYESLIKNNLSIYSINKLVSIDIKENEIGFIEAAEFFGVPFETIKTKDIEKIENRFKGSDFVKKSIGVSAVSEPCGFIGSNEGVKVVEKHKKNGMTISIWQMENTDDEMR